MSEKQLCQCETSKFLRAELETLRKQLDVAREALMKLNSDWLIWPTKTQPDPRVIRMDSRSIDEIRALVQAAVAVMTDIETIEEK